MKGIVEIYGTNDRGERELILTKENLTVVGFAENIVDLLTTPSSTTYPLSENANILDASNYAVQAISTSKNAEHFRKNLHSYETSNLLNNTAFDSSLANPLSGWTSVNATASANIVEGYKDGVSGTLLQADTSGGFIFQRPAFNGSFGNTEGKFSNNTVLQYTDTVASVDIKWNEDNPPAMLVNGSDDVDYKSYSRISYSNQAGIASSVYVEWNSKGEASLRKDTTTKLEAGTRYLGSNWYRVFLKIYNSTSTSNNFTFSIYPCNAATLENSDVSVSVDSSAGSIYIARLQVELGRHPTKYSEVSTFVQSRDDNILFSPLKQGSTAADYNYYIASAGTGAYTLSGVYDNDIATALGTSAYIPSSMSMTPAPHPEDRYLTAGARTPVEEALEVEILQGQNPYITNLSATLMLSSYGSPWTYASGYTPAIGRHAAFLGAYAGRSNAARVYLNIVSALDYNGYSSPLKTTSTYLGDGSPAGALGVNQSVDILGYITLSDNGDKLSAPPTGDSAFYKLYTSDFSSTGEVKHVLNLGKGAANIGVDAPMLNLFGGVDTLGLWGMDVRAIRDDDYSIQFPIDHQTDPNMATGALTAGQKRKYKLYNKIVLTDNAVKNDGGGTDPGIFDNYSDINIIWSLKFL